MLRGSFWVLVLLEELLTGYRLEKLRYFHALHNRNIIDYFLFRDDLLNLPLLRSRYGIDLIALRGNQTSQSLAERIGRLWVFDDAKHSRQGCRVGDVRSASARFVAA
jgi:hypothetical protein